MNPSNTTSSPTLARGIVIMLAVMCGISIASAYYAQPLLPGISVAVHF